MTEIIYLSVSEKIEASHNNGRRVSISGVLAKLGVSRSGYNSWKKRLPSDQKKRKQSIQNRIKEIHDSSKQIYGAPKITKELIKEGETISERTVGTYMREMGIKAHWVKPWTITTKDSDFSKELHNILKRDFNPSKPNSVWCSDITYIWTIDGFVYLTSVMDLFSRRIISWDLSQTLEVSSVIKAINAAKARRSIDNPVILHSGRGSQYVSNEYKKITTGMNLSYSKKANPWDNACIESFHSLIKREHLHRFKIHNYLHARHLVFEYIETFYNTVRTHSHCDYLSPVDYEKQYTNFLKGELKIAS